VKKRKLTDVVVESAKEDASNVESLIASAGVKSLAELTPENTQVVSMVRKLDAKVEDLQYQLKVEKGKRQHADSELREFRQLDELMHSTREKISQGKVQRSKQTRGNATAVICACDWHAEEHIDPNAIGGVNEFNLGICERRINRLWDKSLYLIDFARNISDIRNVVLWLGGDLINGYIHEELEESNILGPAEAILFIQEKCVTGIEALAKHKGVESITVISSFGNHGRTTKKRRVSTGYKTSWEWLAYRNMAEYYRNKTNVRFQVGIGYFNTLEIQGFMTRFHHGDNIRYQGGVGGLTIPVNKAIAQWNKKQYAHFDFFGHWHTYMNTWNWTSCGCLVGYNAYAESIKADFQEPTQTFSVIDKKHGKVLSIPIFVE